MLTLHELSEAAHVSEKWLREVLASDDPPPTHKRSKQVVVLWSDYLEWSARRYGDGGTHRGQEVLDIKMGERTPKQKPKTGAMP
jgi:hypothetical protein